MYNASNRDLDLDTDRKISQEFTSYATMSGDILHSIFYQIDGEACAHTIKDFFSGRKYKVQFNLHELQDANITNVSNVGVFILLLTPHSYDFILSMKHLDLNAIFPNPELSVVLFFGVEKSKTEIRTLLSSRIRDFHKWTILEYLAGSSFNTLDKDIMNLVERSEGCPPAPSLQKVWVWTREVVKSHEEVLLMFTKPVDADSEVKVIQEWDGLKGTAERLNPMAYSFTVGDVEPGERNIEVLVNDTSFGRIVLHVPCVESKMEEISKLLHNVINPVELICHCLHIVPATREDLDGKLLNFLSNNTSSISHIFEELKWERFGESNSNCELPTLLHFGAKYGLRLFCMKLLCLPGGKQALQMKNKDGMFPYQIARKEGFDHVALALQNGKKDSISVTTSQSPCEIQTKDYEYVHLPQSPLGPKEKGMEDPNNLFNNGTQLRTRHQMNPLGGPKSSPRHVQIPEQQPTNVSGSHTSSVRSSSDSGLGGEVTPITAVRRTEEPKISIESTRGHSFPPETSLLTESTRL